MIGVYCERAAGLSTRGVRWRRTGAGFFNDGVSNEGVSHVVALGLMNGLLVRAGGSLAGVAPARVFLNDGVSDEGVLHVI